jgi:hypothetical protein
LGGLDESLRAVEAAKRGLNYEVGTLVAPDGTVLREYGGEDYQVDPPRADRPMFEGNIFTHNHPTGRTFTLEDILSFAESKLHEARVSTPQGTFYSLRENSDEVNRTIGRVMQAEKVGDYLAVAFELQREMMEAGEMLVGYEYQQRLFDMMGETMDVWLTENAEEFGYLYTKGAI